MKHDIQTSSPGRLIALGEIVGTHGVRGLLRFHPYDPRAEPPPTSLALYVGTRAEIEDAHDPEASRVKTVVLDDARPHGNVVLLRIRDVDTIEAAEALVGSTLSIREADLPIVAPGEVYVYQLTGLDVFTTTGEHLGTIERSFSNGANEVLVVHEGARELLIPMIADVVQTIDLAGHRVVIEPIPGLLDQ